MRFRLLDTQVKTDGQKDLGAIVTRDLKWKLEILAVSTKAIKMLGLIRRSCVNISMTNVSLLHYTQFSQVISHFGYCSQLRSPQSVSLILKIERVQSCATKCILSLPFTSVVTSQHQTQSASVCEWYLNRLLQTLKWFFWIWKEINKRRNMEINNHNHIQDVAFDGVNVM